MRPAAISLPLVASFLLGGSLHAASDPTTLKAPTVPMKDGYPITTKTRLYRLSEVKAGDRGVGYTVFTGDQVQPFEVEVLGILQGMLGPHRDVILVRLTGREIEFAGVISGMSGSPVFIDGRLVGAVSFRFGAFSKEAIGGITPIESMLDIVEGDEVMPAPKLAQEAEPIRVAELRSRELRAAPAIPAGMPKVTSAAVAHGRSDSGDPQPIETPVILGGFAPEVAESLKSRFEAAGMVAVLGAVAGQSEAGHRSVRLNKKCDPNVRAIAGGVKAGPIAPGAPIAAVLMRGDLFAAGTGTVTFVDGELVLGFGHPFFGYGHILFPMATASILNTLASLAGSFKQAAPALEVGTVTHDRLTAIGGRIGELAPMIPVAVKVQRGDQKSTAKAFETHVELVESETWMPIMLDAAVNSAATARLGAEVGGTVDFEADFQVGDRTLRIEDTFAASAPSALGGFVARDVSGVAQILMRNGLARPKLKRIDVHIRAKNEIELGWIESVTPEKTWVRPGETIHAVARIKEWRGGIREVPVALEVPRDASGEVELFVGGSMELDRRDAMVWGDRLPTDLDDLLAILADRRPGRGLFARIYLPRPGLRSSTELLSALPIAERMTYAEPTNVMRRPIAESFGPELAVPVPKVIFGSINIPLRVKQ